MSAIESMANISCGFWSKLIGKHNHIATVWVFPGLMDATFIGVAFTAISLIAHI